ncbi:hypothetical protein BDR03DRAFT_952153 [Suillus americanus]|nr:hypothetical protein BDR03DRAFT_952153 [Suillus americanus]
MLARPRLRWSAQSGIVSLPLVGADDDDRRAFCQHTVLACTPTALKPNFPFRAVSRGSTLFGGHCRRSRTLRTFEVINDCIFTMAMADALHQLSWCGGRRL